MKFLTRLNNNLILEVNRDCIHWKELLQNDGDTERLYNSKRLQVDGVMERNVGMKWNSLAKRGSHDRDLYSWACAFTCQSKVTGKFLQGLPREKKKQQKTVTRNAPPTLSLDLRADKPFVFLYLVSITPRLESIEISRVSDVRIREWIECDGWLGG